MDNVTVYNVIKNDVTMYNVIKNDVTVYNVIIGNKIIRIKNYEDKNNFIILNVLINKFYDFFMHPYCYG